MATESIRKCDVCAEEIPMGRRHYALGGVLSERNGAVKALPVQLADVCGAACLLRALQTAINTLGVMAVKEMFP